MSKSFVFILNNIDVQGDLPIEVAAGHFFQKADNDQIRKIKELLDLLKPFPHQMVKHYPYEVKAVPVSTEPGKSQGYQFELLPEDLWKYWIILFEGSGGELQHIGWAASLLENDLELGFHVLGKMPGGFGFNMARIFSFFNEPEIDWPAVTITADEIREISENYNLIKKVNPDHEHITRAFRKLLDLKSLPRLSELATIGLFSIIESLVTHSPKLSESADSLKHQIKTKIPLLSKRFQRKMDYTKHFRTAGEETIWSTLYDYRSCIVHGEHPNFTGSLQVLKDARIVREFLREAVKLMLLLALKEPILLSDLKKC